MREPRGQISDAVRPVGEFQASGKKPVLVVYVKWGSSKMVRDFWHQCQKLGIDVKPLQYAAFEVVGAPDALETLTGRNCIESWHFCLSVAPPRAGTGTGPEKVRSNGPARKRIKPPDHNEYLHVIAAEMRAEAAR